MKKEFKDPGHSFFKVGTVVVGDIESKEEICIAGKLVGKVYCEKLMILHTAQVEGDIVSPWITICGTVKGNIVSNGIVSLREQARVVGSIRTKQIEIEPGAEFNGDCRIL